MLFAKRGQTSSRERQEPGQVLMRGEKTVLREFTRADVDRWVSWPRHADPMFESYNSPSLSERQRDIYYQQYQDATTSRQYAVEDHLGDLVGRISLRDADWHLGASVLGVSFHPGRLNQGLGTDALQTFLRYYFGPLQMSVLFLDVAGFNHRAARVYEKCGFHSYGQRWGDPQTDYAGIFRKREYEGIRSLFRWEFGLVRPLLIDMVLRRGEWEKLQQERAEPATQRC